MIWYGRERKMNEFHYNYGNPVRMKYILYLLKPLVADRPLIDICS